MYIQLCFVSMFLNLNQLLTAQDMYSNNPFLQKSVILTQNRRDIIYNHNPFLNGIHNWSTTPKTTRNDTPKPTPKITRPKVYENVTREYDIDIRFGSQSNEDICGRPAMTRLAIGGVKVEEGAYPWIAALYHKAKDNTISFKCGATLISNRHIITAAHCVKDVQNRPSDVIFFFGRLNLTIDHYTLDANRGVIDAKKIYIHKNYQGLSSGDVAIAELSQPIKFTNYIRPLCLWSSKYSTEFHHVVGFTGEVVAWGQNDNGVLNTDWATLVKLPLISKDQCLRSNQAYYRLVDDDTFCAGGRDGTGPCSGDSGSALALKLKDDAWYLRGIVSTALSNFGKCDLNNFVVFVDVVAHKDWISGIIS